MLEPLAALPPAAGALDDELDESAGLLASIDTEPEVELEPDGAGVVEPDAEELELAGGVAGVVEPDAEELELAGGVAGVVEPVAEDEALPGAVVRDTVRSPSLSQPVSNPAPSARDTATARVESLI